MTKLTNNSPSGAGTNGRARPASADESLWVLDWIDRHLPLETTYDLARHDDSGRYDGGWYVGGQFRVGGEIVNVLEFPEWERACKAFEQLTAATTEASPVGGLDGKRNKPWTTWVLWVHDFCALRPLIEAARDGADVSWVS